MATRVTDAFTTLSCAGKWHDRATHLRAARNKPTLHLIYPLSGYSAPAELCNNIDGSTLLGGPNQASKVTDALRTPARTPLRHPENGNNLLDSRAWWDPSFLVALALVLDLASACARFKY